MPTQEFEVKVLAQIDWLRSESERLQAKVEADGGVSVSMLDQLLAATRDADRHSHHIAEQPGMSYFPATHEWAIRTLARAITVLDGCGKQCPHWEKLFSSGGQPGYMFLTQRVVACVPCIKDNALGLLTPPSSDDDRCDWCGDLGVKLFTPHVSRVGPITIVGDACDACTKQLKP